MTEWWKTPFQDEWTLAELVSRCAETNAHRPALLAGDGQVYTHGDLSRFARSLSREILAIVKPGSIVATLTTLDLPCFAAVQAVVTSGCVLAALDAEAPDDRNQRNLRHVGARILITNRDRREQALRLAGTDCRVIVFEDVKNDAEAFNVSPAPTDTVAYVFTSGRSGSARAVIRSHRDLTHAVYCISKNICRYSAEDRMLIPGSPGHVGGLNDILSCLTVGFMAVPIDISSITLQGLLELTRQHEVGIWGLPPSLLRAMIPILEASRQLLSLRLVVTSGEPLLRRDVSRFFEAFPTGVELWQNYGSTETGPIFASQYTVEDSYGKDPLPLRTPHDDCVIEILGSDAMPLPNGTIGQIRVSSPYIARGYLDADEVDTNRFMSSTGKEAFFIGDLGRYAATGELFVAGRQDRQFSRNGRRFEASEIEAAALAHPGVREAVLVPIKGNSANYFVLAVSAVPGQQIDLGRLRHTMGELMNRALLPQRTVVLEQMPRTAGGKVDYRAVQQQLSYTTVAPRGTGGPPQGLLEKRISDCWQEVLQIDAPGREEPFESLGGTSLEIIELSWMLESRLGLRLHHEGFIEATTIAKQARWGNRLPRKKLGSLVTLRDDGKGPYVLMIPGIGGNTWVFAEMCRQLRTPGTFVAVNFGAMFASQRSQVTRAQIAEQLAEVLREQSRERQVVAVGYSLGGVVAADISNQLIQSGHPLSACLLLDPARVAKKRSNSSLHGELRRLRKYFAGRNLAKAVSVQFATFEKELIGVSRHLYKAYRNPEPIEPANFTTVVCSEETMRSFEDDPIRQSIQALGGKVIPCKHVELLRLPYVQQTSEHVDAILMSVS